MQQWNDIVSFSFRMRSSSCPCSGTPSSRSPWTRTCPSSHSPPTRNCIQQQRCCTGLFSAWGSRKRWEWLGCCRSCISRSYTHLGHGKTPGPPCSPRRPPPLPSRTSFPSLAASSSRFPHQCTVDHSNPSFSSQLKRFSFYICIYICFFFKKIIFIILIDTYDEGDVVVLGIDGPWIVDLVVLLHHRRVLQQVDADAIIVQPSNKQINSILRWGYKYSWKNAKEEGKEEVGVGYC